MRPINLREYVAEKVSESFEDDFVSLNQSQRTEVDAARHAFSEDMMLVFKFVADSARTQGISLPSRILDGSFAVVQEPQPSVIVPNAQGKQSTYRKKLDGYVRGYIYALQVDGELTFTFRKSAEGDKRVKAFGT